MVLVTKTDDLTSAYRRLQAGMKRLNVEVTQELVTKATNCHLRPFGGKPKNRYFLDRTVELPGVLRPGCHGVSWWSVSVQKF